MGGESSKKWLFLGGAMAGAPALLRVSESMMPPWPSGVVWFSLWLAFAYGLGALFDKGQATIQGKRIGVRVVHASAAGVALWVAFSFWQASTPHGDVRISRMVLLPPQGPSGEVVVNVYYQNSGKWPIVVDNPSVSEFFQTELFVADQSYIESRLKEGLEEFLAREPLQLNSTIQSGDEQYFSISRRLTTEERNVFNSNRRILGIMGKIIYRDWWFIKQHTDVCGFFRGDRPIILACITQ